MAGNQLAGHTFYALFQGIENDRARILPEQYAHVRKTMLLWIAYIMILRKGENAVFAMERKYRKQLTTYCQMGKERDR